MGGFNFPHGANDWMPSTKDELFFTIKNLVSRKMSLYIVGPDRYLIQNARVTKSASDIVLLSDSNGLIAGFSAEYMGSRVEKLVNIYGQTIFSFHIGGVEYQLEIDSE